MYHIEGRKIFSDKNNKLICTIDGENHPVFEPGMAPAHKTKLEGWMEANGIRFDNAVPPPPAAPEAPAAAPIPEPRENGARVEAIPDCELPEFDRRLGMNTPRLREYIAFHRFNQTEVAALIRRLERR